MRTAPGPAVSLGAMTLLISLALVLQAANTRPLGLESWAPEAVPARAAMDVALVDAIDPASLSAWHDLVASRPHAAGSEGDAALIASLAKAFGDMGLEVEVRPFRAYLSSPVDARLELLAPDAVELPLREGELPGSPYSRTFGEAAIDDLERLGWNAYSGSGDVSATVVYANYGRREDFVKLTELGVDCAGKIVLARYGGNFRGFKAKYAEEAGAVGLIIYTDPKDSGYGRGLESPEGGWANCNQIQRGSLKTLPWSGDPLTPNVEATADARRLSPEEVALPNIPVQPIGWLAATRIMGPMSGPGVPDEWQGGLPFRYRLTGGDDVRVRLMVKQRRTLVDTANVIARLRGSESGADATGVMVGSHHDAWVYGADDPTSGLIAVLECARVLTAAYTERGVAPRRTITFCAWGAEEHGIIGSTEWVEGRRSALVAESGAYFNLDAAASGLRLGVSASPALTTLIAGAASVVPQPGAPDGTSALDAWRGGPDGAPPIGFLGGGSDHVSFLALCALPSASISARGAPGTAYHSLYDDLAWYRRVVGDDYASAALVARLTAVALDRAATAPVLPIDLDEPAAALARTLEALIAEQGDWLGTERAQLLVAQAKEHAERSGRIEAALWARAHALPPSAREALETGLRLVESAWLHEPGLPGRRWYKNLYTAPDETSGYAAWPLPGLQKAIMETNAELAADQVELLRNVIGRRRAALRRIEEILAEGE